MWVNPMLTIWLWGTVLALVLIGLSLWAWYRPEPDNETGSTEKGTPRSDGDSDG